MLEKSIGIIYKASFFLPLVSLRILYYSMIYPYLQYCNICWGTTYSTNLYRITVLQKRVIRILDKSKFDAHTSPLFKKYGLLKLDDICFLQLGQFMFNHKHNLLPEKFQNMFSKRSQFHTISTRISLNYHIPLCRTYIRQFSVCYQGPKFFNSLPRELTNIDSFHAFKKKLKLHFFLNY